MTRSMTLALVLVCLGLPPAFVLMNGASYYVDNRTTGTIVIGDAERDYLAHVPSSYTGRLPVPLVLSLHGATTSPPLQKNISGWNGVADRNGFIVAYPGGKNVFFRAFGPSDVPFITALIEKMQATYNIDPDRIYINGLSNGGGMSYVMSCVLSDRIAAVGAVGAAITMSPDLCPDAPPMPVMIFHGTADYFAKYEGGKSFVWTEPFPAIPLWVGNWARRNHCAPSTRESAAAGDVTRIEYDHCEAPVVLYKIEGGGHTWPGGAPLAEWFAGSTNRNINATELMWDFFKDHPLKH